MNNNTRIWINAGHSNEDSGAIVDGLRESELNKIIRDRLKVKLDKTNLDVEYISDILDLKESINYVKSASDNYNDLAISIHFNWNKNKNIKGVEVYYYNDPTLARIFAKYISRFAHLVNRGARHDSETYVGSLGWLRKVNCRSILIEVGYMSNVDDLRRMQLPPFQDLVCDGIINSIVEIQLRNKLKGLYPKLINILYKMVVLLKEKLIKKL